MRVSVSADERTGIAGALVAELERRGHETLRHVARALAAGAAEVRAVADEHGWRLGRIEDPFGHHWEVGRPLVQWPPCH